MLPKSKRDCTEQGVTEYAQLKAEKKVEEIVELKNAPKLKPNCTEQQVNKSTQFKTEIKAKEETEEK